ncbi:cytochrome c [Pelagibacterium sp. H642]|uniref:c-type cytochrome n=1 Tax=Pelagibacterium sp. H642 TaxID=1881069 RepID=UPI0028162A06|nr:cytochrome c [Pelagibacterium sp. H642]WMT91732.1 cytochrome c [Pelagibacterium sp. H642]
MKKQIGIGLAAILAAGLMTGSAWTQELANDEESLALLMEEGETVYANNCAACHGVEGEGGGGPALVGSSVVEGRSAVIYQILFGATDHGMPAFAPILSDQEIAAVATYIRNSWENDYGIVLPRSVEMRRSAPPENPAEDAE